MINTPILHHQFHANTTHMAFMKCSLVLPDGGSLTVPIIHASFISTERSWEAQFVAEHRVENSDGWNIAETPQNGQKRLRTAGYIKHSTELDQIKSVSVTESFCALTTQSW